MTNTALTAALIQAAKKDRNLAAMLAKVMLAEPKATGSKSRKPVATEMTQEERFAASAEKAKAAAEKRGFKNVKPRENLLTWGAWEAKGFRPNKGEKSIRYSLGGKRKSAPLFHVDQVSPITTLEQPEAVQAQA